MRRTHCPICRRPFANRAAHVPTPELMDQRRDAAVYWCVERARHVAVPLTWAEDVRRSARRIHQSFRVFGGHA